MNSPSPAFQHRHAAHCESGTVSSLLTHHGFPISEPMTFGLAAGLGFAYLPFLRIQEMPLIAYRLPPRAIIRGVCKALGIRFKMERFSSTAAGEARLDQLLARGEAVGLQTSVYWLTYFPEDMRFHFNAHNLVAYGKEGDEYLISDPVAEHPVRCSRADLSRARFAKGLLAPKGLIYYPERIQAEPIRPEIVTSAIRRTARTMLAPVPIAGVGGIRWLARRVGRLDPADPASSRFIGHIVRMQEEIGTGGAGFRFLYAAFLQEAVAVGNLPQLEQFSEHLMEIGDGWRGFALAAARMVKGRDRLDPPALGTLLLGQASQEEAFFRELKASLA